MNDIPLTTFKYNSTRAKAYHQMIKNMNLEHVLYILEKAQDIKGKPLNTYWTLMKNNSQKNYNLDKFWSNSIKAERLFNSQK